MAALPNFRIETVQTGVGIAIKLSGELDSLAGSALLERFEAHAGTADAPEVVLDLAEVSFIDSAGMRAIIVIERSATERALALTITPPRAEITELLQVTGIADRVTIAPSADAAAPDTPFIERIDLELPRDPLAPGRARAELRAAVRDLISDSDRATLTLLTSELVTNAVIHPEPKQGPIALRIVAYRGRVRVEVGDAGSGFDFEHLPSRPPREAGGHGLIVVDGLSSRWGTRRRSDAEGGGFNVWFELDVEFQPETAPIGGETSETSDPPDSSESSVAAAEG